MPEVRTRFAPSPTGFLHIGGARTAIFAWAFAKHYEGKCILRIEDTDKERSTPEATQAILDGLDWLGLTYNEVPYFQSHRSEHYQAALEKLLKSGDAYPCYCSVERLQTLRDAQIIQKQKPRYDGLCRDSQKKHSVSEPFVVRFKNPTQGVVLVEDKILGNVSFSNNELDDFILARSDRSFTYNFTVVVDDYELAITHVIRGNDHLNNTPRQINVLKALGASIPIYMHLPMLHSEEGKKLSKREGAASVMEYQAAGFLPEAVVNYLVRLGWSHGDQEIFSLKEIIRYFDGHHLSKSPATLNPNKLLWLNQHYLKNTDPLVIAQRMAPFMQEWKLDAHPLPRMSNIIAAQCDRVKTLKEMAEKSRFFYEKPIFSMPLLSDPLKSAIKYIYAQLDVLMHWEKSAIYSILTEAMQRYQLKPNQLFQVLRMLLTGATISPPVDITIELLGKSRVLDRFQQGVI